MSTIFKIIADGKQVGITVSTTREKALKDAIRAHTRSTVSKEFGDPDYRSIRLEAFGETEPVSFSIVKQLLVRIAAASNSRFVDCEL
ncbi:MAG: hypothetical protein Q7U28_09325 [Aquabacterium sp.]|nr:hypothetical protein [Aquabacterium sp.]